MSSEEIPNLLDELAALDVYSGGSIVEWTAPEDGVPGSGAPPFQLGGVSRETVGVLIKESPDVRATRVLVGATDAWLRIYAGNHLEHGPFTISVEEGTDTVYVMHKGHLLRDDPDYWRRGNFHDL